MKTKTKAWNTFSLFVRIGGKYGALNTTNNINRCECFTCRFVYDTANEQAGHFIPGRSGSILFVIELVNPQCFRCNINLKGNWIAYEKRMIEIYGKEKVEEFKLLKNRTVQWKEWEYEELRIVYRERLRTLLEKIDLKTIEPKLMRALITHGILAKKDGQAGHMATSV